MPDIIRHRQDCRFALQWFANNSRKKTGRSLIRFPWPNANRRESDADAIEETATGEVGKQEFSNRFLRAVRSQRRQCEIFRDYLRKRSAEDRDRAGKHDSWPILSSPDGFEEVLNATQIDPVPFVKIGFRFTGNHCGQMIDDIRSIRGKRFRDRGRKYRPRES